MLSRPACLIDHKLEVIKVLILLELNQLLVTMTLDGKKKLDNIVGRESRPK